MAHKHTGPWYLSSLLAYRKLWEVLQWEGNKNDSHWVLWTFPIHIRHTVFHINLPSIPGTQTFWDTRWYMFCKHHLIWDKWPLLASFFWGWSPCLLYLTALTTCPSYSLAPGLPSLIPNGFFPRVFFFNHLCLCTCVSGYPVPIYIVPCSHTSVGQPRKPKNVRLDRKGGKQREGEYPVCFLENPWLLPPFYEETFRMWATDEAHCAHIISRLHRPAIRMMEKDTQRAGLTWVHGESIADRSRGYILGPVLAVWIPIPSLVI